MWASEVLGSLVPVALPFEACMASLLDLLRSLPAAPSADFLLLASLEPWGLHRGLNFTFTAPRTDLSGAAYMNTGLTQTTWPPRHSFKICVEVSLISQFCILCSCKTRITYTTWRSATYSSSARFPWTMVAAIWVVKHSETNKEDDLLGRPAEVRYAEGLLFSRKSL